MSDKKYILIIILVVILWLVLNILTSKQPSGIQEKTCFRHYDASRNYELIKDEVFYKYNCKQFHK